MEQLNDKTLITIALILFAVEVLVNALWSVIDPLQFTITHDVMQGSSLHVVASCQTKHENLTIVRALSVAMHS